MLVTCWSVKGGSGTTVVAAALALGLARSSPSGTLLVDLAGDAPAALGLPEPAGPGLADWVAATDVGPDALLDLIVPVDDRLAVLPRGATAPEGPRLELLAQALANDPRAVVVDAGTVGAAGPPEPLVRHATATLMVLRPCYLALRRAATTEPRPSGIVLVREPGRALGRSDVEAVLGAPVRAEIELDPAIARAVDAGLLAGRVPLTLTRPLARVP